MKRKTILLFLLTVCLCLTGCGQQPAQPAGAADTETDAPKFTSSAQAAQDQMTVQLYFRYLDSEYLSAEERTLHVSRSDAPEKAIVQALLDGPSAGSAELSGLFPDNTQVLSVTLSGDTLFVTFSSELMNAYADETASQGGEATLRRKLCMAALADTLTGAGCCARVQVLVKRETSTVTSLRLPANYFRDTDDETPLGPMTRDESVILTPYNTAQLILNAWMTRDNERLYHYIGETDENGAARPGAQTAYAAFDAAPPLTGFTLTAGVVSPDGQSAILCADLTKRENGQDVSLTSYPLRLRLMGGLWKIDYSEVTGLFDAR